MHSKRQTEINYRAALRGRGRPAALRSVLDRKLRKRTQMISDFLGVTTFGLTLQCLNLDFTEPLLNNSADSVDLTCGGVGN